ncbi:glycosyltransferase family 4 protein [Hahella sp. SMD15-11]|uniref:Glycosyltransferase family 4 protein n=1 Tax=Thermohahella caldifontis TaxID=3142973 RepID=A0AB39USC8_9GAMM
MKILRVYPFLPPRQGGLEKHVLRLSQLQRQQGHDVVVAFNCGNMSSPFDIRLLRGASLARVRPQVVRDLLFYIAVVLNITTRRLRFDVVHLHGDYTAFYFGPLLARLCSAKILCCSVHGKMRRTKIFRSIYSKILSDYDLVYCTGYSEYLYLKNEVRPSVKVFWQPSGVDNEFLSEGANTVFEYDVVTVGSLVPVKNHKLFIDVANKLPSLKFAIAGSGALQSELTRYIQYLKADNVKLLGQLTPSEIRDLMRNTKIFLLTSLSEGTPTVMLEAMSAGAVVVTTPSNDYSLILGDNINGIVTSDFDAEVIASKIIEILENPLELNRISTNAKRKSAEYQWERVAQNISSLMLDGLGRR